MYKKFFVFLFIISALGLLIPGISSAITVGPAKLEYKTDPGQTTQGFLTLKNEGNTTQTFYPSFERFTENTNGEKIFTKEISDLATWFRMPSSVDLKDGESKQIPFTIEVPADAPPGGHFAVIWWSAAPPNSNEPVAIVTRAGILVYMTVSGNISESGQITSFGTDRRLYFGLPISFTLSFHNGGNIYEKPRGNLRVTNIFGAVKADLPVNQFGGQILPGNDKTFSMNWEGSGFFFGPYEATLNLSFGDKTATDTYWFILMSPLALIIFILLIIAVFALPKAIRSYNRWVIKKAQGRN